VGEGKPATVPAVSNTAAASLAFALRRFLLRARMLLLFRLVDFRFVSALSDTRIAIQSLVAIALALVTNEAEFEVRVLK
jgi:hypothetical protein